MAWVVLTIATVLLADLLIRVFYVRLILPQFETKPPFNVELREPQPGAERLSFRTADGFTLRGALHLPAEQPPRGLIVFCPELDGNHWSALDYGGALVQAGFALLAFDFRNQGESGCEAGYQPIHWPTTAELRDLEAALQYVRAREDLRELPLGLFGISRGSLVALTAAADADDVLAVCGEGTYTVNLLLEHFVLRWAQLYLPGWAMRLIPLWHFRVTLYLVRRTSEFRRGVRYAIAERVLPKLRRMPVLLIAGERDSYVQPSVVRSIAERIGGSHVRVWEAPHAKHNQAREAAGAEYDRRLVEHFDCLAPRSASDAVLHGDLTAATTR